MTNPETTDKQNRERLSKFTPREIIDADHKLLLGATNDFDGILSPSLHEVSSKDLIKAMTAEQVETLLLYLE